MNFNGQFNPIGRADISQMKKLVQQLTPQHWIEDHTRQSRYEVHKDTQTIALVYDADFRHTHPTQRPAMQVFEESLIELVRPVARHFDNSESGRKLSTQNVPGYCVRATLVRLNPGGMIDPHQDKNFSLAHSHRIHIPIVTNELVRFHVGGTNIHIQEGEIIEINNRREHFVENPSKHERVHLILDWVIAGEQCCCSSTIHPGIACSPKACLETDRLKTPCHCYPE